MTNDLHTAIWFELWITDVDEEKTFYGKLFGWTFTPLTEYHPDYWLIDAGDGRPPRNDRRGRTAGRVPRP